MMPQDEKVTSKNDMGPNSADGAEDAAPNFRGLKILVITLGVAIAGMMALIVYTISQRAAEGLMDDAEPVPVATTMAPSGTYGNHSIERPEGAELISVQVQGAELVFHFQSEAGDMIITLNRETGAQTRVDIRKTWQSR